VYPKHKRYLRILDVWRGDIKQSSIPKNPPPPTNCDVITHNFVTRTSWRPGSVQHCIISTRAYSFQKANEIVTKKVYSKLNGLGPKKSFTVISTNGTERNGYRLQTTDVLVSDVRTHHTVLRWTEIRAPVTTIRHAVTQLVKLLEPEFYI